MRQKNCTYIALVLLEQFNDFCIEHNEVTIDSESGWLYESKSTQEDGIKLNLYNSTYNK